MPATRRIQSLSCSALVLVVGLTSFVFAEDFDKIKITKPDAKTTIYEIDQPNVKQRLTEYKSITFQPGDTITISAGGCCQTGGLGKTWKRYVDPQGPNSERLYYGTIWIPGATTPMVRLQGVNEKTVQVAAGTPTANLFLRLGYIDDNYDDNGYTGRDDGTGDQCKGLGNAYVRLTVKKGQPPIDPVVAPLDLFWTTVDDNFIPKNPRWGAQKTSLVCARRRPTGWYVQAVRQWSGPRQSTLHDAGPDHRQARRHYPLLVRQLRAFGRRQRSSELDAGHLRGDAPI